tara:strand:- start:180 stop:302 length:123 start_codon:yes stop_codon:yes gene_type:complete
MKKSQKTPTFGLDRLQHDFEVIHRLNDKGVEKALMALRLG